MADHLQSALSKLQQTCASNTLISILLGGDFNFPSIDWTNNSFRTYPQYGEGIIKKMMDVTNDLSLIQHIHKPTRGKNILDLLFSTNPDMVQNVTVAPGMSDYDIVLANINTKLQANKKKPRMVCLYSKGN